MEQEKGKRCGKCFPAGREIRSPRRQSPTRVGNCKGGVSVMRPQGRLRPKQNLGGNYVISNSEAPGQGHNVEVGVPTVFLARAPSLLLIHFHFILPPFYFTATLF